MSGRLCLAVHEKRRKPVVWVWHMGCMISYFILCAIEYLPGLTMLYRPLKKSIKSPPLPDTAGDRKIVRMQKIHKNSSDGPERVYCHIKAQVGTRKSYELSHKSSSGDQKELTVTYCKSSSRDQEEFTVT